MYAWEMILISVLFVIIECAIMELQSTSVGVKANRRFHLIILPLLLVVWVYTWTHEFSDLTAGACVYAAIATFMFFRSSVRMLRSVGTSDTVIATKLMKEFNLTREEALAYM